MSRHIIHKQKAILNVLKLEDAHAFQNRVSTLLQHELAGRMEAIFDELFPSDDIIRIDSLQLDLGNISSQNFEQDFKDNFTETLRKSLSAKKDTINDGNHDEILNNNQSALNAFIYFLENGTLPWYCSVKAITDWEADILKSFDGNKNQYFFDWFKDNYKANPVVLQRLVLQFSNIFLEKLLSTVAPSTDDAWGHIYNDLTCILSNCTKAIGPVRTEVWTCLFQALFNDPALENNPAFAGAEDSELVFRVLNLLTMHFGIAGTDISASIEALVNRQLKTDIVKNGFNELKMFLVMQEDSNQNPKTGAVADEPKTTGKPQSVNDKDVISENKTGDKSRKASIPKYDNLAGQESLFIKNCGVVILHYFLKPFFADLKLLTDEKFADNASCQRAVLLLHYLATGNGHAAEFDLILEKILCGYPFNDTLPASIILSRKEKAESKKLLKAVTDHWIPLKNTSAEGLRSAFFERDGKLTKKENGWLLTVEQKTVDVLLNKLPWGFSTIRLPWMEQILNVDWY